MDEDSIGLVLVRASELRSKLANCIHRASAVQIQDNKEEQEHENGDKEEGEETENLLNIRDALESLEAQLSSLQSLQQQQCYEREAALSEIDYSRQKLLEKLKEYKGEDLEVIHEAAAFASEAVEGRDDLLLPPYPSRPPRSLVANNGHLLPFPSSHKSAQNGITTADLTRDARKHMLEPERKQAQVESKTPFKGLGFLINAAAKTVVTLVGVLSVLHLAGFQPRLRKGDAQLNVFGLFQQLGAEVNRATVQCPPGKVLVVEDGETRCLVKERVEIPFESVIATADVKYGCG